jgi:hypothetical protein
MAFAGDDYDGGISNQVVKIIHVFGSILTDLL